MNKISLKLPKKQNNTSKKEQKKENLYRIFSDKIKIHPKNINISVSFFKGIQFKLIISFLIPVLFILILGIASYSKASNAIVKSYETSTAQTLDSMNNYLSLAVDTVQSTYKSYDSEATLQQYFKGLLDGDNELRINTRKAYNKEARSAALNDALISSLYFISDDEPSITSTQSEEEGLYSAYTSTPQGAAVVADSFSYFLFGNECDIDSKLKTDSTKYCLRLARKMSQGKVIMIVDINRSVLAETLSSLNAGKDSYTGLITSDGTELFTEGSDTKKEEKKIEATPAPAAENSALDILLQSSNSSEKTSSIETMALNIQDLPFYQKALEGEASSGQEYVNFSGKNYLFCYSKLTDRNAMLISFIPTATIKAQANDIRTLTITITLFSCIVAIILGYIIAHSFGGAISDIVTNLKKVAQGDLTVSIQTSRKDEFLTLCEGINEMTEHMKELLGSVSDVSLELNSASEYVTNTSDLFIESSNNISNSLSEIEVGTTRIDEDSQDCLNRMDSLSDQIKDVRISTTNIQDMTKLAAESVQTGLCSVDKLSQSAHETSQVTHSVMESITLLAEKSKSISEITSSINKIAGKTSLLALNASIEAARAGEAGRGFAVVADEIKQLASQSSEASSKIGDIIEDIIKNTNDAVKEVQKSEEIVNKQQESVDITTTSFQTINEQMTNLVDALQGIVSYMEQIESNRKSTLDAISGMSAISTETAAGTSTVSAATVKQLNATQTLSEQAEHMQALSNNLASLMQRFKL